MPNRVAMLAGLKNLATRPAVDGTVDRKVSPITAADTSSMMHVGWCYGFL